MRKWIEVMFCASKGVFLQQLFITPIYSLVLLFISSEQIMVLCIK